MKNLLKSIEDLKNGDVGKLVDARIKEFKSINKESSEKVFNELCFCILTANFNAERSILIQGKMGDGFCTFSEKDLAKKLTELGHRFPNARAKYISECQKFKDRLKNVIQSLKGEKLREYLVKNIKGIGYKEAGHFLRNIGFDDFAIIDFHIIDILVKNNLIIKPKVLSKKNYLEIESLLTEISKKLNLTLAELDLYLWYLETGKILK